MSSQIQGIHATSPDTDIELYDDAASEVSPHGTLSSLARRATQEGSLCRHSSLRLGVRGEATPRVFRSRADGTGSVYD